MGYDATVYMVVGMEVGLSSLAGVAQLLGLSPRMDFSCGKAIPEAPNLTLRTFDACGKHECAFVVIGEPLRMDVCRSTGPSPVTIPNDVPSSAEIVAAEQFLRSKLFAPSIACKRCLVLSSSC